MFVIVLHPNGGAIVGVRSQPEAFTRKAFL